MHVIYYVTSHGYGHGVRTAAVCNAFSPQVRITFRTTLPEPFFREEVRREFDYAPATFDCGCLQTDSLTTDVDRTFRRYRELARENEERLAAEVAWCHKQRAEVIVSDIAPFAFKVAATAGIPSVAVTNFTWHDVYSRYLSSDPSFEPVLSAMRAQYARADLLLALEPAPLPMGYFPQRLTAAPVGRAGRHRRTEIERICGLDAHRNIALIYFGHLGLCNSAWERLASFDDWHFIGICPLPSAPPNYHLIAKNDMPYQDLVASVDLMICKIGYGVTAECMLHGTPLVYLPRDDFAESPFLERGIAAWGHGHRLTIEEFTAFAWGDLLRAIAGKERPVPVTPNGAMLCAREIERMARG
ncbi:MAG: hypothetical protein JXA71_07480 [Chitinispirillaceae bacterium]|nr:hypothetical protein [Chitinispirillaceae bacterium]